MVIKCMYAPFYLKNESDHMWECIMLHTKEISENLRKLLFMLIGLEKLPKLAL